MADPSWEDEPVPVSELEGLEKEKQILNTVYRHVEHQQALEQVAGVAGVVAEDRAVSINTDEPKSPPSPWVGSITHRTPSLPISAIESEGSGSILQTHPSCADSTEASDSIGRREDIEELLSFAPSLESALKLNMVLQRRFEDRIQHLEIALKKNLERQKKLRDEIMDSKQAREYEQKSDGASKLNLRISFFCVPYFKNRSGMPAPMNEDAKMKLKDGNIDLYVTRTRTWLVTEKDALNETVRQIWREQCISKDEATCRTLERKLKSAYLGGNQDMINMLEEDLKLCKKHILVHKEAQVMEIYPPRGEETLDWDTIAAKAFDGHRTTDECRLQWENQLHPDINTSKFTEKEDVFLQNMVSHSRSRIPNWERIASDLKTNRTAFSVMQRYVSFIEPSLMPKKWTKQDSDKLLHTVHMLKVGSHIPWAQVHQHFVGYTRPQLQSRWRMINPEVSKGPFTVEEDFILIKGLHTFGLNFDNIAHFMPGRSFPQVRDRYRRTILPWLSLKPWTSKEDDIVIKHGFVGPKHWRKMIMELPRREPSQIRCRYHTIQVWQTISKTNMTPPPLFPVSTTVDPQQIIEIRKAMIMETNNVKELVDNSRSGCTVKSVLKELEERRLLIKERKAEQSLNKIKKVVEKRGRHLGSLNPHHLSLLDVLLTEFFIPYRFYPSYPDISLDCVKESIVSLSEFLQLNIKHPQEIAFNQLPSIDAEIVKELVVTHVSAEEGGCASDCPACKAYQLDYLPLLPPNKTTLGAFKSLLLHRPKLNEMASKEFALYRYSKNELMMLDSASKGKRPGRRKHNFSLNQDQGTSEPAAGIDENDAGSTLETAAGLRFETVAQDSRSYQKTHASPTKFHITSLDKGTEWKKTQMKAKKQSQDNISQAGMKAYSRAGKMIKTEPQEHPVMPIMSLEVNGQDVLHDEEPALPSRSLSQEEEEARKRSDDLLFHRMLSLFCWPAFMTQGFPSAEMIDAINKKVESGDIPKPIKAQKLQKNILTKDDLDIKEQVEYINQLSEIEVRHQEMRKESKKRKISVSTEGDENSDDLADNSGDNGCICKEESDDANIRQDEESSVASEKGSSGELAIKSYLRKRQLKSLRRSLVMKKVWDGRRKGVVPQRTSDRDKRNYNPRASRTRDRVRKDILKRPLKTPNPWDLPIDGPLRVKPQVPYIPVKENFLKEFNEGTHISSTSENDHIPSTSENDHFPSTSEIVSVTKASNDIPQAPGTVTPKVESETKLRGRKIQKVSSQDQLEAPIKMHAQNIDAASTITEIVRDESQMPSNVKINSTSNILSFLKKGIKKRVGRPPKVHKSVKKASEPNSNSKPFCKKSIRVSDIGDAAPKKNFSKEALDTAQKNLFLGRFQEFYDDTGGEQDSNDGTYMAVKKIEVQPSNETSQKSSNNPRKKPQKPPTLSKKQWQVFESLSALVVGNEKLHSSPFVVLEKLPQSKP